MREVWLDGSPEGVCELTDALRHALAGGQPVLPLNAKDPGAKALRDAMAPDQPVEPDTAVIIATSGSTGAPKGVLLSAEALLASANATYEAIGPHGPWLLATPPHYIGGLQVITRSIVAGLEPILHDGDFASGAEKMDGDAFYTALVPTQLVDVLDKGGPALEALKTFEKIIIGGAPLHPEVRERATRAGLGVVGAYGMSETASGCFYDGRPLHCVGFEFGDNQRIRISGDTLAHGYRLQPELTAECFADGWFETSDRGRIDEDGRLEVLGRVDDMINTGGVKVPATAVERVLISQFGVKDACVVGVPHHRWGETVVAVIVADGEPSIEWLRAAVRKAAGPAAVPKRFEFVDELPLRGPGKIDRAAVLRSLLSSGK
ncbi:o-succinylbenzoate--CoA ligase [Amycolatopsis xylanica]|uniref:o-succinylbenzoate--CoA ligase n=1 Tax=Amycolatopsis xylanica TaxID=589385 RepID=UPI000B8179FE|nr:o-succinylbenzoate--CoA ligase [Amycolatopsis xylanica]